MDQTLFMMTNHDHPETGLKIASTSYHHLLDVYVDREMKSHIEKYFGTMADWKEECGLKQHDNSSDEYYCAVRDYAEEEYYIIDEIQVV